MATISAKSRSQSKQPAFIEPPPPLGNRRHPRITTELLTWDRGYVNDLSLGGMKVSGRLGRGQRPFRVGQTLDITLGLLGGGLAVKARVKWYTDNSLRRSGFDLGLEFVELSAAAIEGLTAVLEVAARLRWKR